MSHEIRTPLNAILGYSQLLQEDDNLTKTQHQNIETINRSGEHLLELINDILDMSKIEAGRITLQQSDFNFKELIKEVEQLFKIKAQQKRIDLLVKFDENLPSSIIGDASKIKQIIINLVGNALKFTSAGFVNIIAENRNDETIVVKVVDSGLGIPKKERGAIFKPFKQVKNDGRDAGGTGLGLAISKKLSQLMDGDITVKSEYGKGSEFIFSFKYSRGKGDARTVNTELQPVESLIPEMVGLKVAIVDDRFENRDILYKKLHRMGFDIQMAENGKEAIELYQQWKPDIILMDIVMPVMNGIESTREILRIAGDHDVKIFVVSASALESEQNEILEIGATSFIKKPVIFNVLFEELYQKAGLRYIYKNQIKDIGENDSVKPSDVPEGFKNKLVTASTEGNFMLLQELLEDLEKETDKSFKYIANCINEMEFEEIINWLKT